MKNYIIETTARGMLIRDHVNAKSGTAAIIRFVTKYAHLGVNARNTRIVEIRSVC